MYTYQIRFLWRLGCCMYLEFDHQNKYTRFSFYMGDMFQKLPCNEEYSIHIKIVNMFSPNIVFILHI